jgi:hypothetical protein
VRGCGRGPAGHPVAGGVGCRGAGAGAVARHPLLDVPSQVLRDRFVPRLEQMRLQALEDRTEADLRLGRQDRLIPELRELAAEHPVRERFHG